MKLDELYAPYDTEGRFKSYPQVTVLGAHVHDMVEVLCDGVTSFNKIVPDAKIVAEISDFDYSYTDDEKVTVFRTVRDELDFTLDIRDAKLPRLTKKERARILNLFAEWEKQNPNHKKTVKKPVKKVTKATVEDETPAVTEVEQSVEDYRREDYTDVVDEATHIIVRNWLNGEADTSWLTICETLWDVKPDCKQNEETAIVNWIENDVYEAIDKARKAINN